jgi:hypothetical protein
MNAANSDGNVSEQLLALLHGCFTHHIARAETALSIADAIGNNAWSINKAGFGDLFRHLQVALADEINLALTKLLEPKNRKYPGRRSISVVLDFLKENSLSLPMPGRARVENYLVEGAQESPAAFKEFSDAELTCSLVEKIRRDLPKPKALWHRRDKKVAHTEEVITRDDLEPKWDDARSLIEYAQKLSGLIGEAYGIFYFEANDGTYMLSDSSMRMGESMLKVLELAGLLDVERGNRKRIEFRGLVGEAELGNGIWTARVVSVDDENIFAVSESLETLIAELEGKIDSYLSGKLVN